MSISSSGRLYPKKPVIILCYRNPIAILQHQLEYWFSKCPDGFYKFLEPCKHPLYKAGDSWTEEIGYSRPVFNKAFDTLGIRYKSKTEFLKAQDKFQGKLYASYHDRKTNKTFFVRNSSVSQQIQVHKFAKNTSNKIIKKINQETSQNSQICSQKKREIFSLNIRSRN